ncbi:MAG: MBL fold metallo-hydrolase [Salinicola sp.]|uniref:MBL fold metallo-hydrolase n=1 Tax=Salinicola sp. TaxID=1978524 RepID=UPI001D2EBCCF|nr:MBL fold metallo-hydrolase [Salinicola sp.]NRB55990.1 MBL fold metallo-hydrolase [Salinicola sp.]
MPEVNHYRVGDAEVTRVTEQVARFPAAQLFPDHQDELAAATDVPHTAAVSIHSWIVRTPRRLIVIDTATGNDRDRGGNPLFDNLQTQYAERLSAAGVDRHAVDTVLLTHLHTDHVGWNTYWNDGRWLPMFPNARYIFSAFELDRWQRDPAHATILSDSIQPILDAGLAETIDPSAGTALDELLTYYPSPGHSPDHASIALMSQGEYALFGGDVMHHPVQTRYPHWNSTFCEDKPRAGTSRAWALDWCAEHDALYFSSHFAESSVGRITRPSVDPTHYDWRFV